MDDSRQEQPPHEQPASSRLFRVDPELAPGLYVVSTPIGNLRDITLRALDILASADIVCAEDTRVATKLLSAFGVSARLRPYHDHNGAQARPALLNDLQTGARIALMSDAGTPLISDPGYKLVREAAQLGIAVYSIPGASAPLAALASSGLPTDCFTFAGFPPPRSSARREFLRELGKTRGTLIPRGEIVVLVGPGEVVVATADVLDAEIAAADETRKMKDVAAEIAEKLGLGRRVVYERMLELRDEKASEEPEDEA
ncbi:MAG: hypothetical protein B7Y90_18085 [Alphaproteobacteria bacterium 32-64-14]|nr:MAG: hypothetical protein B7Y90_18085 [Alphaproteobacteria bacterium 32-64-14]